MDLTLPLFPQRPLPSFPASGFTTVNPSAVDVKCKGLGRAKSLWYTGLRRNGARSSFLGRFTYRHPFTNGTFVFSGGTRAPFADVHSRVLQERWFADYLSNAWQARAHTREPYFEAVKKCNLCCSAWIPRLQGDFNWRLWKWLNKKCFPVENSDFNGTWCEFRAG